MLALAQNARRSSSVQVYIFIWQRKISLYSLSVNQRADWLGKLRAPQRNFWNRTSTKKPNVRNSDRLTVVVGVAERPGLVRVKVRVSSDAGAGEVGVSQETALAVERRAVTMETRGEEDHDVGLLPLVLDLRVRHLLSGKRQSRGWTSVLLLLLCECF